MSSAVEEGEGSESTDPLSSTLQLLAVPPLLTGWTQLGPGKRGRWVMLAEDGHLRVESRVGLPHLLPSFPSSTSFPDRELPSPSGQSALLVSYPFFHKYSLT